MTYIYIFRYLTSHMSGNLNFKVYDWLCKTCIHWMILDLSREALCVQPDEAPPCSGGPQWIQFSEETSKEFLFACGQCK